jgi:hypothetical protein
MRKREPLGFRRAALCCDGVRAWFMNSPRNWSSESDNVYLGDLDELADHIDAVLEVYRKVDESDAMKATPVRLLREDCR